MGPVPGPANSRSQSRGPASYDDDSFSHDCSKAPYPALNALKFTPHFICFSATFQLFPVIYGTGLPKDRPNSCLKSWYSQKGPDSQCGNPVPFITLPYALLILHGMALNAGNPDISSLISMLFTSLILPSLHASE